MSASVCHYFEVPAEMCIIDRPMKFRPDIQKWCEDTCKGFWFITHAPSRMEKIYYRATFARKEDAVLFKLFWLD